ncbi:MAG: division/cell wall cluster transcriptional repressor MraZ [Clostridia bacterium]|nr:division/cell wall cluster transcriptional repressor MraZ [Clostridia bacterium]
MLIGTYEHAVDTKGRLFVPAKLRGDLGETFVGTKGVGSCLFIFSLPEWEKLAERLKQIPLANSAGQGFVRMLYGNAFECQPDKQGRILIPKTLRDRIGLESEAVITGVMTRAEVWPKQVWEQYCESLDETYDEQMEALGVLGI